MSIINNIQDFFLYGMDREVGELVEPPRGGIKINLGPGDRKTLPGVTGYGFISNGMTEVVWHAPDPLPLEDGSVTEIHCYHFLEHLNGEDAISVLKEIDRVLVDGGVAYIVTPYYSSSMQAHALDHKSAWNEGTWKWLFSQDFYSDFEHRWSIQVQLCLIIGIVERNMCLMTQLVKYED